MKIDLEVNERFAEFLTNWTFKFYVLVGGYGSSKSYHTAMKLLLKLMKEKRNLLVVRNEYVNHRDSTFSLFRNIANKHNLEDHTGKKRIQRGKIRFNMSPLEIKFSNGSKIIFRGMDDPEKLKSIEDISIVWVEECSEIPYAGFKELIGRLRHSTLKTHMMLTTNPVSKETWTFKHFFYDDVEARFVLDDKDLYEQKTIHINDVYYHHSVPYDNFWLSDDYIASLKEMNEYDPDLYRIAYKGQFGVNGLKVLPQIVVLPRAELEEMLSYRHGIIERNGLDFGFVTSFNALLRKKVDTINHELFVMNEFYEKGLTDDELFLKLKKHLELGEYNPSTGEVIGGDIVIADTEQKSIAYMRKNNMNMKGAKKGPNSRVQNIRKIKRFKKIYIAEECKNTVRELKTLTFKTDKNGKIIEDTFNIDAHTFDAMAYGLNNYEVVDIKEAKKIRPTRRRQSRR